MPISVRPPSTAQELEQLVRLRYQVYVEEEGRFTPHLFAEPAIFDAFDTIPHTLNLLAFDEQEPAGFIRLTAESEWGSPLDAHYDLSAVRARCGAAPVTVSMLGVSRKARDRGVAQALILQVIELIHASGYTDVMVVANAQIVPLLRRYQLQEVGTPFHCPRVGQRLSMLHAPTHLLPREAHSILPGHSSRHRVRFEHGELLLHPERPQTSAYFIRRGQVRLSLPRGDGGEHILAEVGPGALIGALERTASGMSLCSAKAIGPVEVLEFPLTPLMSTMKQDTPATFNSTWQPETPQNLIGLLPRAQESMQRLLSRSVEGLAPSGVKLFNHYLAARVIHQLGELGIFRRLEQGPLQPLEVAQERGIEPTHLEALLHFLEQLGWIEHTPEGWRMAPALAHRFDAEHGFLQWLIGAYEPVLDGLPALLRGHARYGHELRRQDREVARSSARISEVYTDPAMYLLLKLEGVSTVADIGMGSGLRLIDICQRLPHLRGVGLDLSELTPSEPWPLPFQRPEQEDRVLVASAWCLTEQMLRPRALAQLLELVTLMGRQKKADLLLLQLPLAVEMLAQKQGFSPSVTAPATPFYAWWTRTLSPVGMERQPELGDAGVKRLQVPAGTPLYGWGDAADGAFLLARGKVELAVGGASQRTPFALVEAGGTFGEEALLEPSTRRWAQALALTDVEVWHLERERLHQRRAADTDIRLLLEQGLLGSLHRLALQQLNPGGISKAVLRRAEQHQRREELQEAQALWRLS
ncbi:MAG: cyclic nucleotide-binding domain-containing protein [Myxococcota bacterium]